MNSKKYSAMKTYQILTSVSLFLVISINSFAGGYGLQKETYIDDIPFNTKEIFDSIRYQQALTASFNMEEENFIEDIPFETSKIVAQYHSDSAMNVSFEMPEEKTIDDIPFNTLYITSQVLYRELDRYPVMVFVK